MKHLKKPLILFAFIIIYTLTANIYTKINAKNYMYKDVVKIPKNRVGLVLGTGKYNSFGQVNLYYKYRIEAALSLYKSGKIEYILISGDNSRKDYDEPTDFKNDLVNLGVPANKIYLDYAGFRTLDSLARAKAIFGLNSLTIISQKFHNERALFLAKHFDLKAIAYNAKDVNIRYGMKTKFREYLARTKATIDVIFNVKPKFLGEKIEII